MVKIFPKENEGKRSGEKSALDLAGGSAVVVRGAGRKNVIHEEQTIFSEIFIIHTRLNLLKRHSLSVTFMYIYMCVYICIFFIIIIRISPKLPPRVKRYISRCVCVSTKEKRNFAFIKLYI